MSRLVHFEIHAEDPERCRGFYSDMFGWTIEKWSGPMEYWTITTGPDSQPGINGGLLRRRGPGPVSEQAVNAFVCTIEVSDLDSLLTKGQALGATVAVGKMPIPGIGWLAYLHDPEGNIVGLMQNDPKAGMG
jgi:hypothetical protein